MKKNSYLLIVISIAIVTGCKKNDSHISSNFFDPKADFFYINPRGETLKDSIIYVPYIPNSSPSSLSFFKNKDFGSANLFKWVVIDSTTHVQDRQSSAGDKFSYSSNKIGTKILSFLVESRQSQNNDISGQDTINTIGKIFYKEIPSMMTVTTGFAYMNSK